MEGKFLDHRAAVRSALARRRARLRCLLELTLGVTLLGIVWGRGWIHPVPGACLLGLLAGRACYRLGKEEAAYG